MFCLVETVEDGLKLISAVPKKWVTDNILSWPLKRSELQNGRKNCISPENNWTKLKCRKLVDNIDDWRTAVEQESSEKYQYLSSSTSDEFECIPRNENVQLTDDFNQVMCQIVDDSSGINTEPINQFESTVNPSDISVIQIQETPIQQEVLKQIQEMRADFQNLYSDVTELRNDFTIHVAKTDATLNIIVDMLSKKNTISDDVQIELDIAKDFPLKSKENLEDMERKLRATPTLKHNLISHLATFGGLDGPKSIRIISRYMFDDNMLCEFSWGGTTTKHNFNGFKEVLDCIIRAVRYRHKNFSDFEAAKFYKDYIKLAKFRLCANSKTPTTATTTTNTTTTAATINSSAAAITNTATTTANNN